MKKTPLTIAIVTLACLPSATVSAQDLGGDTLSAGTLDLAAPATDELDEAAALRRRGALDASEMATSLPGDLDLTDETKEPAETTLELPDSVKNLNPSQKFAIKRLLEEAAQYIQGIRLQEGLDRLIQVDEITPDLYQTHNLRGAIFTKLRDFPKARKSFESALKLKPGLMEATFNLAELDFVERHFADAEAAFINLKTNFKQLGLDTKKLIDYKLFISTLLQSKGPGDAKEKAAKEIMKTFDFLDDFPVYYYSQAALSFHNGNKEEAEEWLATAQRIYDKATQTIYIDALIEMGWVDSL